MYSVHIHVKDAIEKGEDIHLFFDHLRCRFTHSVPGFGFDAQQYDIVTFIGVLQGGRELLGMHRYDPIIVIRRENQYRRVLLPCLYVVQWSVGGQKLKVLFAAFGIAVFVGPMTSRGEVLEAQHIDGRHMTQNRAI